MKRVARHFEHRLQTFRTIKESAAQYKWGCQYGHIWTLTFQSVKNNNFRCPIFYPKIKLLNISETLYE